MTSPLQVVQTERAWLYLVRCNDCGTEFPLTVHDNAAASESLIDDPGAVHQCEPADDGLAEALREAIRCWWVSHGQIRRSTTGHIAHLVDHAVIPTIRNHEGATPA